MSIESLRGLLWRPVAVLVSILAGLCLHYIFDIEYIANWVWIIAVFVGASTFLYNTLRDIVHARFGLDYIALTAIIVAFVTQDYLVGAVIVLMLTTGEALEEYASLRARKSLTALIDRIPKRVTVLVGAETTTAADPNAAAQEKNIEAVRVGEYILVRRGEVIPLDGVLETAVAETDESSLTGEPFNIVKEAGDIVRSGTVNISDPIVIRVTVEDRESTYRKIIGLVERAQESKAPLVRLADRYSLLFTIVTAVIAISAYLISGEMNIVLAVLVVATPCPLLIATPIALIGGMNSAAKQKIILKNLASIEVLSRVSHIVFDKTGTITLGEPVVTAVQVKDASYSEAQILAIAASIEHNSLHPIAKAIVLHARLQKVEPAHAINIQEKIGEGISGEIDGKRYLLTKYSESDHFTIALKSDEEVIALLEMSDEMKQGSLLQLQQLAAHGYQLEMLTGDKESVAKEVVAQIGVPMTVQANCTPEQKLERIRALQSQGAVVAMVGDGINDAPALAAANVGIVFSNEENTAASEAAAIVLLGGELEQVLSVFGVARRSIKIALQSIWVGIGLSVLCMIAAAFGYIPPLIGSLLQEGIDILVIVNALRASRG